MSIRQTTAPLPLQTDHPVCAPTLTEVLTDWAGADAARQDLARVVETFARSSVALADRLAEGRLAGDPTAVIGRNRSGDRQQALDMAAHEHFLRAFKDQSIATVVSEEAEEAILLTPGGRFDIAMDPIDGSGSIGIGAPLGALFCVFPHGPQVLRKGREIIAAGYVSFGHSVDFGYSLGEGTAIATLSREAGQFHVDTPGVRVPETTTSIAFNASNQRHWDTGLQHYVADLLSGSTGPRGRDFNMRWIAAAVGDLHRILRRGGVFMYPADARDGYGQGYLRLAYEAFPIAYLIEQAGGAATDGARAILDLVPDSIHARVPLVFGSRAEVATIGTYTATSPLGVS